MTGLQNRRWTLVGGCFKDRENLHINEDANEIKQMSARLPSDM